MRAQLGAYDLKAAIDGGSADTCPDSIGDKALERPVVDSVNVEAPKI
jgi:hypothetical protein